MQILVINNNTTVLDNLLKMLVGNTVTVISQADLKPEIANNFDAIILTGGRGLQIEGNEEAYKNQISLIQSSNKPILGICLGHELIATAFGLHLNKHMQKQHGEVELEFTKNSLLFRNVNNMTKVYVSHWFYVSMHAFARQNKLQVLATCDNQVMAFKHSSKPIFGLQFHPELSLERGVGQQIIKNFLSLC